VGTPEEGDLWLDFFVFFLVGAGALELGGEVGVDGVVGA
jgi:hypothetical protein